MGHFQNLRIDIFLFIVPQEMQDFFKFKNLESHIGNHNFIEIINE